ncbi:PAS domain-containing protein [Pseudomonas sp. PCH446]
MFNKRLKQELSALREELSSVQQVKDSLEQEMLVLTLDPDGRIESANQNFIQEMLYPSTSLVGRSLDELVPEYLKHSDFHLRFKNALTRASISAARCACCVVTARKPGCVRSCSRFVIPRGVSAIFRFTPTI